MALDRVTMGWQTSDLIIIAARPSMGKTAFALSMTRNITIDYIKPVGYFSLEMSAEQLWTTTMNPETRTMLRVSVEDAIAADEIMSLLMGEKVEPRREFIEQNSKLVLDLDI